MGVDGWDGMDGYHRSSYTTFGANNDHHGYHHNHNQNYNHNSPSHNQHPSPHNQFCHYHDNPHQDHPYHDHPHPEEEAGLQKWGMPVSQFLSCAFLVFTSREAFSHLHHCHHPRHHPGLISTFFNGIELKWFIFTITTVVLLS